MVLERGAAWRILAGLRRNECNLPSQALRTSSDTGPARKHCLLARTTASHLRRDGRRTTSRSHGGVQAVRPALLHGRQQVSQRRKGRERRRLGRCQRRLQPRDGQTGT
jgi:hypothetical protein